jgi:hypothetical protein
MRFQRIKNIFQKTVRPDQPPIPLNRLEQIFKTLGVDNPSGWARSGYTESIPQLHRYLFLRGCWNQAVDAVDNSWIDVNIQEAKDAPGSPHAYIGEALERMLALGVSRHDIAEVVRGMQGQLISGISYLIDDPRPAIEHLPPETQEVLKHIGWALVEIDANGSIGRHISGLHESVHELGPKEGA